MLICDSWIPFRSVFRSIFARCYGVRLPFRSGRSHGQFAALLLHGQGYVCVLRYVVPTFPLIAGVGLRLRLFTTHFTLPVYVACPRCCPTVYVPVGLVVLHAFGFYVTGLIYHIPVAVHDSPFSYGWERLPFGQRRCLPVVIWLYRCMWRCCLGFTGLPDADLDLRCCGFVAAGCCRWFLPRTTCSYAHVALR